MPARYVERIEVARGAVARYHRRRGGRGINIASDALPSQGLDLVIPSAERHA